MNDQRNRRSRTWRMAGAFALLSGLASSGCALTSKAEPMTIRWFSPESVRPRITAAQERPPTREPVAVELGRVTSGVNLRERIAYRDAAFEVGFYDDKRWTERPEVYVRRELARTLYEEHGMVRALAGQSPVLEIELISFEELRRPTLAARIQLRMILHDDRDTILEKTITVDQPVAARGFEGLVQAMAQALERTTEEVARETERAIRAARPEAAPAR